jgi:hypothetical protein
MSSIRKILHTILFIAYIELIYEKRIIIILIYIYRCKLVTIRNKNYKKNVENYKRSHFKVDNNIKN